nr:uncharacterized protein LOC131273557 [Dasypus novemcinctus]
METFKCAMKRCMKSQNKSIEQIEQLFMKIDYAATGGIQWDGVCTYLQLEYLEQAAASARQREVSFLLPALLQRLPHGRPVLRILSVPDDTLITVREDGAIYFWSPQLKLKRRKQVFDKPTSRKPQWVTDATSMPQYNKLIVATGNRELQLYEVSNLEPYCQLGGLEALPLKLDYCLALSTASDPSLSTFPDSPASHSGPIRPLRLALHVPAQGLPAAGVLRLHTQLILSRKGTSPLTLPHASLRLFDPLSHSHRFCELLASLPTGWPVRQAVSPMEQEQ